jgi:hypothetical protein
MTNKRPPLFTPEELKIIGDAAQAVWNEIGYDVLQAIGQEKGGSAESATVKKSDVIEMVLDAGRLEDQLKRTKGVTDDLQERVRKDLYSGSIIERYLGRSVFTFAIYGM